MSLKNSDVSLEKTLTNKLTLMWQNIENIHTIFTHIIWNFHSNCIQNKT